MICCKCHKEISKTYGSVTDLGNYCKECAKQNEVEASKLYETNMKSVLEIEKKNAVKEFAEKLKVIISEKGTLVRDYTGDKLVLRCEIDVDEVNAEIDKLLKEYKNDFSKS